MFEGDLTDVCAVTFQPMSMAGRAEGLVCADLRVRTHIAVSGNFHIYFLKLLDCQ
jgi:hypothetical protein